jgi:hypothetical protein
MRIRQVRRAAGGEMHIAAASETSAPPAVAAKSQVNLGCRSKSSLAGRASGHPVRGITLVRTIVAMATAK